ncbi:hypothetical protein JTE90_016929 [Oedothorax gibbosus]|uniref:Gustatory receptor n=1 Tax=Oedothorax gibbosus TaxID=931172 RepID=A0AAV6UU76_9ARAC|nr:hypothetical protein JTE90_016929 [Oedothorax gibbosus]
MILKFNLEAEYAIKLVATSGLFLVNKFFIVLAQVLLTLMYVVISYFLSQSIRECANSIELKLTNRKSIADFMKNYDRIHRLVHKFEKSFSWQVLFLVTSNFIELFKLFSEFFGFNVSQYVYKVDIIISSSLSSLSFFSIAIFASEVDSQDRDLRRVTKEVSFNLSVVEETRASGELLAKFMKSKEGLTLSACGLFQFTKSFLLASFGVLLTYNLLILQVNTTW